ncbi:MFS transporter [Microbacterium gallinarum]|uniref:MFS transporter n=1 Tax=Microbacterium gallinarum TaxID=2762209 RepID=A0ABR8X1Q7_9MICO|nr:MFS transporter [Microbacterium gallinarum]MBD8022746.1 MFS transporter [Microbacterium gallinarum]
MTAAAEAPRSWGGSLGAFRHRSYTIFWFGALISSTGTWLGNLTVPYVLYQQTQSAVWVGLAAAAQFGPAFILAPLGGSLADTRDRRKLLLWTQAGLGVIALLMWAQWASGLHEPLLLILLLTCFGVLNGMNNPAWQSLVNDLVPREDVTSAVTLNSLQFNLARAIGPALGGVLLATLGATWAFFFNALSFAIVVVSLLFVRRHPSRAITRAGGRFAAQWKDALAYIGGTRAMILAIVLCCVVGVLGNPIFSLTVVFAETVFDTGPVGLGLLTAALGAGAVGYALAGAIVRSRRSLGRRAAAAMIALGLALCLIGVVPTLVLGIVAAMAVGAAFLAAFATLNTTIQLLAPDQLRGRVLAARHMVFSASIAVGVLLCGILTDVWGVQWATIAFGAALVVVALLVALLPGWRFSLLDQASASPDAPISESDSPL